jgi:hypothetical protein
MNVGVPLRTFLAAAGEAPEHQLTLFAFMHLGVIESLANGAVSATDAVRLFFNAENCLYVRKHLKERIANRIMSHGVQLPDLFDALPAEEAQREFLHELATMRTLCLKLIERERLVA